MKATQIGYEELRDCLKKVVNKMENSENLSTKDLGEIQVFLTAFEEANKIKVEPELLSNIIDNL